MNNNTAATAEAEAETDFIEHFIPVALHELVDDLIADAADSAVDEKHFQQFCELLQAVYHHRFHHELRAAKRSYLPFAPDADTVQTEKHIAQRFILQQDLTRQLDALLQQGNYQQLDMDQVQALMTAAASTGLSVSVDLNMFELLRIYVRGRITQEETRRAWPRFWQQETVQVPVIQRMFLLFKAAPIKQVDEESRGWKRLRLLTQRKPASDCEERFIYLKLFKNIPEADLQMLFPNCEVRIRPFDKIKLAVTGGGGTIGGMVATATKVAAAANVMAMLIAIAGFAGLLVRQVSKIFTTRTAYMMRLAQHLYYHNQANNLCVISRLVDMAEVEEGKEALLAYYLLLTQPEHYWTDSALDEAIESWVANKYQVQVDFEVKDGLRKLLDDGLALRDDDGRLRALPLDKALARLDDYWDKLYDYPAAEPT